MFEEETNSGKRKRKPKQKLQLQTEQQIYDYALNLLSFRDHSQKEMRQKLTRKGANEEQIKSSIEKLTDYGLMDEARFAERVYEGWLAKRVYGKMHLLAELQKKGVPQMEIQKILDKFTPEMELERAKVAAEQFCRLNMKKIITGLRSEDRKEKQKIYASASRYLLARGFSSDYLEIMKVCLGNLLERKD